MGGRNERVVAAIYGLDEPWRSQFVELVANLATGGKWNGREPRPEELEGWLRDRPCLRRNVESLLRMWSRDLRGIL